MEILWTIFSKMEFFPNQTTVVWDCKEQSWKTFGWYRIYVEWSKSCSRESSNAKVWQRLKNKLLVFWTKYRFTKSPINIWKFWFFWTSDIELYSKVKLHSLFFVILFSRLKSANNEIINEYPMQLHQVDPINNTQDDPRASIVL
jgi:hypothetical protein